jgi:hypothetical protein
MAREIARNLLDAASAVERALQKSSAST